MASNNNHLKERAAARAVDFVQPGMVLGLGHGSTMKFALQIIAERLQTGALYDLVGVPCSPEIEAEAQRLGIPLTTLEQHAMLHLTIDGADEVDPHLNLIKGGGGALLREKIVAQSSVREVIAVDGSKLSPALGTHWAVPVEVSPFGWGAQQRFLQKLGADVLTRRRADGSPFVTDNGNLILDCNFGVIADPHALAAELDRRAGIIGHGLFLDLATDLVIADDDGVRHLQRGQP